MISFARTVVECRGERVFQAGLGPKPCPAAKLTETRLAESLMMLLEEGPQMAAAEAGRRQAYSIFMIIHADEIEDRTWARNA